MKTESAGMASQKPYQSHKRAMLGSRNPELDTERPRLHETAHKDVDVALVVHP